MGLTQNIRGVYPYFRYAQTDVLFLGADLSTSASLTTKLKIKQNTSLIHVSNRNGSGNMPFIPPNRFDWAIRFEEPKDFLLKNFFFESKIRFTAKQGNAPRVITPTQIITAKEQGVDLFATDKSNFDFMPAPPAYWLLNMFTGFSVKSGESQINFSMAVENLLNISYREYTNRFRYYADDRGRNFIFSVKIDF